MQEDLIVSVASRRAQEIERERPEVRTRIENVPALGRAIVHITTGGAPTGAEFIESEASINHPSTDKDYLRYLRDGLYLGIVVPRLPHHAEADLVTRLKVLRERVRDEGFPTTHGPELFIYDYEGNVERA
jgi:hypothetical protein